MAKTSITIPDDLFREARELTDNFSCFVTEAVKEHIRIMKVRKGMQSFGKWEARDKESTDIVRDIRSDKGRGYGDRSH